MTPKVFHHPDNKNGKLFYVKAKERFHQRARPNIQLPVLYFLCSRVQSPMIDYEFKLRGVLGYI
jgi:hypothetical protein